MGRLDGKVAVVTGGSSGIGKGIALLYAEEGADVVIVSRSEENLKEVCKLNENKITYVAGDITKEETVKNIVEYVTKKFGKLDILVNNAGCSTIKPITQIKMEDYDKVFNLDVRALFHLTIEFLPFIIKSKGNIINISSIASSHRAPNLSLYCGSKGAVDNFTRCWALELAKDGVRVNGIAPGAVETNIFNVMGLPPEHVQKFKDEAKSHIPCGRIGLPEDIAKVALFLVSDESYYINGAIIPVDGATGAI